MVIANNYVHDVKDGIVVKGGSKNALIINNKVWALNNNAIQLGQNSTEKFMWPESLVERYEGKYLTAYGNTVRALNIDIAQSACHYCRVEKNRVLWSGANVWKNFS